MATCIKCDDELTQKEIDVGKEKCATCLVRGYKFAMGKLFRQKEALEEKVKKLEKKKKR